MHPMLVGPWHVGHSRSPLDLIRTIVGAVVGRDQYRRAALTLGRGWTSVGYSCAGVHPGWMPLLLRQDQALTVGAKTIEQRIDVVRR